MNQNLLKIILAGLLVLTPECSPTRGDNSKDPGGTGIADQSARPIDAITADAPVDQYGTIYGWLADCGSNAAPVSGQKVDIYINRGVKKSVITAENGYFSMHYVPIGQFAFSIKREGYFDVEGSDELQKTVNQDNQPTSNSSKSINKICLLPKNGKLNVWVPLGDEKGGNKGVNAGGLRVLMQMPSYFAINENANSGTVATIPKGTVTIVATTDVDSKIAIFDIPDFSKIVGTTWSSFVVKFITAPINDFLPGITDKTASDLQLNGSVGTDGVYSVGIGLDPLKLNNTNALVLVGSTANVKVNNSANNNKGKAMQPIGPRDPVVFTFNRPVHRDTVQVSVKSDYPHQISEAAAVMGSIRTITKGDIDFDDNIQRFTDEKFPEEPVGLLYNKTNKTINVSVVGGPEGSSSGNIVILTPASGKSWGPEGVERLIGIDVVAATVSGSQVDGQALHVDGGFYIAPKDLQKLEVSKIVFQRSTYRTISTNMTKSSLDSYYDSIVLVMNQLVNAYGSSGDIVEAGKSDIKGGIKFCINGADYSGDDNSRMKMDDGSLILDAGECPEDKDDALFKLKSSDVGSWFELIPALGSYETVTGFTRYYQFFVQDKTVRKVNINSKTHVNQPWIVGAGNTKKSFDFNDVFNGVLLTSFKIKVYPNPVVNGEFFKVNNRLVTNINDDPFLGGPLNVLVDITGANAILNRPESMLSRVSGPKIHSPVDK